MSIVVTTARGHRFTQDIAAGDVRLQADEPISLGGEALGASPHELVLAGLGACTSMTIKMYADRKGWPLVAVRVELDGNHVDGAWQVARRISLEGALDDDQRKRLLEIANKCPVHKTLTGEIAIATTLV
jgi:putative redox protein